MRCCESQGFGLFLDFRICWSYVHSNCAARNLNSGSKTSFVWKFHRSISDIFITLFVYISLRFPSPLLRSPLPFSLQMFLRGGRALGWLRSPREKEQFADMPHPPRYYICLKFVIHCTALSNCSVANVKKRNASGQSQRDWWAECFNRCTILIHLLLL